MRFVHVEAPKLPEIEQLNNHLNGKRYYKTPEGNKYPSVTTILGFEEKPWLNNWRTMLGEHNAAKETKRCADRGEATHKLIESYLKNEEDFTKGVKQKYVEDFNQLKMYLNKISNIRYQETGLYSDSLGIAGTVDCIGEYNKTLSVIDFKTSTNAKKPDMVSDYRLQCTAYSLCYYELTGVLVEDFAILVTVEKGILPQLFTGKVKDYIKPLKLRIQAFHDAHKP